MAMGTERSKTLHNFTLPYLKWGNQKQLRCMKQTSISAAASTGDRRSQGTSRKRQYDSEMTHQFPLTGRDSSKRLRIPDSRIDGGDGVNGIEAVREKILIDLKTAADKMKDAILGKGVRQENKNDDDDDERPSSSTAATTAAAAAEDVPWKLRTRRATNKAAMADGGKSLKIEKKGNDNDNNKNQSLGRSEIGNGVKLPAKSRVSPEKPRTCRITVPLSKSEIEEDYMVLFGHRPRRRPMNRRPKSVQKTLDTLYPGLGLTEVSLDLYKVSDPKENGKR